MTVPIDGTPGDDVYNFGDGNSYLIHGNGGNDRITTGSGDDQLYGDAGDDMLDGGTGADTMTGGPGDDTYIVRSASDHVVEAENGGVDQVRLAYVAVYTLPDNVEQVDQGYPEAYITDSDVRGNDLNNVMFLTAASNSVVRGGMGNDTISGYAENEHFYGEEGDDSLSAILNPGGQILGIVLDGGSGNDVLHDDTHGMDRAGRVVPVTMIGGTGDDSFDYVGSTDTVIEHPGEGTDTVYARSDVFRLFDNVENMILGDFVRTGLGNDLDNRITGNQYNNLLNGGEAGNDTLIGAGGDDTLFGGIGSDVLDGGRGNDLLDGGIGADTMTGGAGDDNYYVDDPADTVIEQPDEGTDTLVAEVSATLPANVEIIRLFHGYDAIDATGNALDNLIVGNGGDNILTGGGGSDTFYFKPGFGTAGFGRDTVTDFTAGSGSGHDVIQFYPSYFNSYAAVMANAAQVGADTVITLDAADTVTLRDVALATLTSDDFQFG